jgi:hypothetical protein
MAGGRDASSIGFSEFRSMCRRHAHVSADEISDRALRQLFLELVLPRTSPESMARRLRDFVSERPPTPETSLYFSRLMSA